MSKLYTLEDKLSYLLRVVNSCTSLKHLNSAYNLLNLIKTQHPHELHRFKSVETVLVELYMDFFHEIEQSHADDYIHQQE